MSTLALFRIYQAERDGGAALRVDLKQVFKNRIFSNQSINQLVTSWYFYFLVLITLYFVHSIGLCFGILCKVQSSLSLLPWATTVVVPMS